MKNLIAIAAIAAVLFIGSTVVNNRGYEISFGWINPQNKSNNVACDRMLSENGFPLTTTRPYLEDFGACYDSTNYVAVAANVGLIFALSTVIVIAGSKLLNPVRKHRE